METFRSEKGRPEDMVRTIINEVEEKPTPKKLEIDKYLKKLRILGLIVIHNYSAWGPLTTFYSINEASELAKKYAFNPGSLAELSLVAKYTKILEGITETRAIIETFDTKDEYNRITQGYILIEFRKKAPMKKIKQLIEKIKEFLSKKTKKEETKEELEKKIIDTIKKIKSH